MDGPSAARNPIVEAEGLGSRLRALRRAAGMSQSELADGRFSKEYMSQLERGKSRPNRELIAWLAERLGTDVEYLETGVSSPDRERAEAVLETAVDLLEARRYDEAIAAHRAARALAEEAGAAALVFRALTGESRSQLGNGNGDVAAATALVDEARALSQSERMGDLAEVELAYLVGACRYANGEVDAAIVAFDVALSLAERSGESCHRLRLDILDRRSRCYRRVRDLEAAREDAERALDLIGEDGDPLRRADALFQAALVAQREGRWLLARRQAREARELYEQAGDDAAVARTVHNLAGLEHLLGNRDRAVALLHEAFDRFVALGIVHAAYALSSLAEIYLGESDPARAAPLARRALEILNGSVEHVVEIGTAHLSLGRALMYLGDFLGASREISLAEDAFKRANDPSNRAETWLAEGDLARLTGRDREAARLYRQAAMALRHVSS
jgi:tetratricopeptide (TPR) repeat protein